MRPPLPSAASCPANPSHGNKKHPKWGARRRRAALLTLILSAAVSAAAMLPGAPAAAKKLVPSVESVLSRTLAPPTFINVQSPLSKTAALRSPALLFQAAPIQTFAADCSTPKTIWTLGEDVCITASVPANLQDVPHRVQLVNPAGFVVDSLDMLTGTQTVTFSLPNVTDFTVGSRTYDNRGSWRIHLTDSIDANVTALAFITVRDPLQAVTNLQVNKVFLNSATATAGANIQTVVRVFNAGPDAAVNVQFTDVPPANTTFQSLVQTGGPTFNCTTPAPNAAGTSTCTAASLANGEAADFTITYKVNGNIADGAELTSSASVGSDTTETEPEDNGASGSLNSDNPAPPACTMACPDNVTVTAAPGQEGAFVTFADPTLNGTCGAVSSIPASGSFFAIGSTAVTSTTEDGQSCSFVVTVNPAADTEAPSISCPSDITVDESSSAANSATVNYSVTATDDSGAATVACDPPSGSSFPVGISQVQCTATDAAGNTDSCSFNVTVNQLGCDLDANSAPPTPNVATLPTITRACSATLLPTDDPTATDACGGTINGDTASDRTYNAPGTYTVVWTYTDSAGNVTTQNQTVVIQPDNSPPVPDAPSLPTVTGECFAEITGAPPTATDDCGGSDLVGVPLDPLSYSTVGTHVVRWKFTDPAGNSTIQNQSVVVTDTHAPSVSLVGPSSVTVECHTSYTDAGATAADNCSPAPTPTANSNVNVNVPGTYQVVWTATDAGGNSGTATRTVVVVDTTAPTISCPADILVGFDPAVGGAVVTFPMSGTDSCAGALTATPTTGLPSGSTFPLGTTVNTFVVTDGAGLTASCSFKVTVALTSIVGLDSVSITGAGPVDSYDSNGGYPAAKGSQASVVSNGTITMTGSAKVFGSVRSTQAGVVMSGASQVTGNAAAATTVARSGSATVGGTITNNAPATAVSLPPVASCGPPYSSNSGITGSYSYNSSTGDLSLTGVNVATLANGTYCFRNLSIGNSGQLRVNGPVTIKITGTLSVSGAARINNTTLIPGNLRILSSYGGSNGVTLGGSASTYMVLYAPGTSVSISGASPVFGTVAGKSISISNSGMIHYDIRLQDLWPDLWQSVTGP